MQTKSYITNKIWKIIGRIWKIQKYIS